MSNTPKFRANIVLPSGSKELFSVVDRLEDGILITSGTPMNFEAGPGRMLPFKEQHYSVHPKNDDAITVTQQTTLTNGETSSLAAFVKNRDDKSLWPIYARRMPMLDANSRNSKARAKDVSEHVCTFDPLRLTLCYSVFVSKGHDLAAFSDDDGCNIRTYKFHRFDLVLVWTFMLLKTFPVGDVVSLLTSAPKLNGVKLWQEQVDRQSFQPSELLEVNWFLMNGLSKTLQARLKEHVPEIYDDAVQWAFAFTKFPL